MGTECIPICRVCMQKSPEFVDFDMPLQNEDEEDTSITYLDFFFECTRIEVELHEGGSECFCLPCGDELRSFYKFVKIAQMTDRLLKAKHSIGRKSSRKINSTSHIINELKHKNDCVPEDDLLCIKNNTEAIVNFSDEEDTIKYLLEETCHEETVKTHRLVKLQVDPVGKSNFEAFDCLNAEFPTSENELISNDESHVTKNIETKLNKKKSKTGPAECAFCHEILRNQKLLDRHLVEEHQRRTKPCEICGKMVIRMREHLLIHEREKHRIQRPKTECPICFRMISKQTISRHIRHVHRREIRKHKCAECSQTFADTHKLKVHMLKGHHSPINIKCLLCTRTFSNGISLNNHLRIHPCLERVSRK